VNPKTGIGLMERIQVSVIAKNATTTDAFATAVSVLGVRRGLAVVETQPDMAALILGKSGKTSEVFASPRFKKIPQAD